MEEKEFRSQLMESMKLARKQGMCLSERTDPFLFPGHTAGLGTDGVFAGVL